MRGRPIGGKNQASQRAGTTETHLSRASQPPITIGVGRVRPLGTADKNGVMIGLETLCFADFMNPDLEDRFVTVIAHEYVHVQHEHFFAENPEEKVLKATLIEGGAEFIGELISGSVSSTQFPAALKGREKEFETAFFGDLDKKAVGSAWLYNYPGIPCTLRTWAIGSATDHQGLLQTSQGQAPGARDIIELHDPKAILAKSGWRPGIDVD